MKHLLCTVLAACLVAAIFSGCAQDPPASTAEPSADGSPSEAVTDGEPFVITYLTNYYSMEPPPVDHEIYRMIEEQTGCRFDVTWVPSGGYPEKVTLVLASNDLPMCMAGKEETRKPNLIEAQRAGMFWELTDDILGQFPLALSKLDENINNNLRVDGKLYALYGERPIGRSGVVFRRDWIKQLGLPEPNTAENLDQIVKAFSEQDPDGNGKQDTYGMVLYDEKAAIELPRWLCVAFGGPNEWGVDGSGKFTPAWDTDAYFEGLDMIRDWYANKYINQDFVALKAAQDVFDAFNSQRCGMVLPTSTDDALKLADLYDLAPDAVIDVHSTLFDVNGTEFVPALTGHNGGILFAKSKVPDEATLRRILGAMDMINNKEGDIFKAMVWGLEGRHYTVDAENRIVQNQEQKELRNREINNFIQLRVTYDHWGYTGDNAVVSDLQAAIFNGWQHNPNFAVPDPSMSLISDTYVSSGNQLDNIRRDANSKFIMGELDEVGWKAEMARWHEEGGDKIIAEYEAGYTA